MTGQHTLHSKLLFHLRMIRLASLRRSNIDPHILEIVRQFWVKLRTDERHVNDQSGIAVRRGRYLMRVLLDGTNCDLEEHMNCSKSRQVNATTPN